MGAGEFRLYDYLLDELEALKIIASATPAISAATPHIQSAIYVVLEEYTETATDDPEIRDFIEKLNASDRAKRCLELT